MRTDFVARIATAAGNSADQSAFAAGIFYVVEVEAQRWGAPNKSAAALRRLLSRSRDCADAPVMAS